MCAVVFSVYCCAGCRFPRLEFSPPQCLLRRLICLRRCCRCLQSCRSCWGRFLRRTAPENGSADGGCAAGCAAAYCFPAGGICLPVHLRDSAFPFACWYPFRAGYAGEFSVSAAPHRQFTGGCTRSGAFRKLPRCTVRTPPLSAGQSICRRILSRICYYK